MALRQTVSSLSACCRVLFRRSRASTSGQNATLESSEVGAEIARVRIASIELAMLDQVRADDVLHVVRKMEHERLRHFGMKIAAEALELRRNEHRVRVIDLFRRAAPPRARTRDGSMRGFQLIEGSLPRGEPVVQRARRHVTHSSPAYAPPNVQMRSPVRVGHDRCEKA